MKKISFIFCLFFSTVTGLYAQFFGYIYRDPYNMYGTVLRYPEDGKFRVVNNIWDGAYTIIERSQILVYGSNLQLIDSVNFPRHIFMANPEPIKVGNRLLCSVYYKDTMGVTLNNYAAILELDTNYAFINLHKLHKTPDELFQVSGLCKIGNRYYIGIQYLNPDTSTVYKLDSQFALLDSVDIPSVSTAGFELWPTNNRLIMSGGRMGSPCSLPYHSNIEELTLDTNFNRVNCISMYKIDSIYRNTWWQNITGDIVYTRIKPISNTKTVIISHTYLDFSQIAPYIPKPINGIVNAIYDQNNQLVKYNLFYDSTINTSYTPGENLLAVKGKYFLTVGSRGFSFSQLLPQTQKTKIFVNKTDTMGNVIWTKLYGGDMNYVPQGINFTPDGGCLISGLRYDSTTAVNSNKEGIMESFLLKLDANGTFIGVGILENGRPVSNPVRCYPNPAENSIRFSVPFELEASLKIFDKAGKLVLEKNTFNSENDIQIEALNQGIYTYNITTKTNSYSGKFIKK